MRNRELERLKAALTRLTPGQRDELKVELASMECKRHPTTV